MHVSVHGPIEVEVIYPSNNGQVTLRDRHGSTVAIFTRSEDKCRELASMFPLAKDAYLALGDKQTISDPEQIRWWLNGIDVTAIASPVAVGAE